ncbi:single-pass membrane and coiled-coil domain-containing protein 4 isoform X1 [Scleropages formosus]|uniref:single-pass membrane and coiled-coil domain-containing protein 4 isoform X1 n=1 Tax=Scleropages formosus TaxID=113540 RepID=UPI0010FAC133|nr:single-pass membrane and coiled-coil domain-containing protein 4 isoform X1 [Scleropages formosus]
MQKAVSTRGRSFVKLRPSSWLIAVTLLKQRWNAVPRQTQPKAAMTRGASGALTLNPRSETFSLSSCRSHKELRPVAGAGAGRRRGERPGGSHEAAQGQAQEGDVQGQEGAQAGHAGSAPADRHRGVAHAGCRRAAYRRLCLRGHAARRPGVVLASTGPAHVPSPHPLAVHLFPSWMFAAVGHLLFAWSSATRAEGHGFHVGH